MKSWKTTLGGILLGVGTPLATAGEGVYSTIGIFLQTFGGMLVGWAARDNDKSSESVGAS